MAARLNSVDLRNAVPVDRPLSIFDPVYLGVDEFGLPVWVPIIYRNILIGGEPGSGKSGLLNNFVAHAALCLDCRLILLDGKLLELGLWKRNADAFVGPDLDQALRLLKRVQTMVNNRCAYLEWCERRKIEPKDTFDPYLVAIDEIAFFSATIGDQKDQDLFVALLRDLVARGRAVGIMVVAATQRPSSDIIKTSLRDLFAWRFAGRCTTDSSSDIVLGQGWASQGYTANSISPTNQGSGYLIAEGGIPMRVKAAYLNDGQIKAISRYAHQLRTAHATTGEQPALILGGAA
jgi:S-DNA-T family DNA segregation ATPase FtsK/SpoIIIE